MNSLSHLYVAAHQNEMLNLAASERLARPTTRTDSALGVGASRIASTVNGAFKSVWSLLSGPAERPSTVPPLANYPFRG